VISLIVPRHVVALLAGGKTKFAFGRAKDEARHCMARHGMGTAPGLSGGRLLGERTGFVCLEAYGSKGRWRGDTLQGLPRGGLPGSGSRGAGALRFGIDQSGFPTNTKAAQ
jgi:hypothetical protein